MRKLLLQLFLILSCHPIFAQNLLEHQIDSLLTAAFNDGLFNGSALVANNGKVILHKSYGFSDKESNQSITIEDKFYIGSLTKQFTAVLILKLQEEGFIDIRSSLSKYLPEFKDSTWENITVYHLLTHTSGFGSYTSNPDFDKSRAYSQQQMLEFIKHPLLFEPGSSWNYSNSGYYLLGTIAERITSKKYGSLLENLIFSVLGMNNTAFVNTWLKHGVAKGYWRTIDGISPMPKYSLSSLFSTGGMYSTAGDLFKWDQALYTNTLLSDSSKNILFDPVQNDYACGWYVKKGFDENGTPFERHFHGGWIKGYHSYILRRIPSKQVVILLDNSYSQDIPTIKNRIWSALVSEEIRKIKPKLSNLLYDACAQNSLKKTIDTISNNITEFEEQYAFEEFDINTVAYRLMEAERFIEASVLFEFNINRYPKSWNVYDSMGELQIK